SYFKGARRLGLVVEARRWVELVLEQERLAAIALDGAIVVLDEAGRRDDEQRDPAKQAPLDRAQDATELPAVSQSRRDVQHLVNDRGAVAAQEPRHECEPELVQIARVEHGRAAQQMAAAPQRRQRSAQRDQALQVMAVLGAAEIDLGPRRPEGVVVAAAAEGEHGGLEAMVLKRPRPPDRWYFGEGG